MQSHCLPQAPLSAFVSHLPPNDRRHRTTRSWTFGPQSDEHLPLNGVQGAPFAPRWGPTGGQPSSPQSPTVSDATAGVLHVNIGPYFREVTYNRGSTPTDERRGSPRHRSRSPRRLGSSSSSSIGRSSRCRSRSRSSSASRSRTRSPSLSGSRSRSPRCRTRRSPPWSDRSRRSPRQRSCSRGSPSPLSPRRPVSRGVVDMLPSNASKSSALILQYFGVKVRNLPDGLYLKEVQYRVKTLFKAYGFVISTVVSDSEDGRCAVVMYQSADSQTRAVEHGGEPIFGKRTEVIALSSVITRNCFGVKVTSLPRGLSERVLLTVFKLLETFGVVVSVKLYEAQAGRFAVAKFERQVEQIKALGASGTCILGCTVKMTALKARRSERMDLECERKKARAKIRLDSKCSLRRSNAPNKSQSSVTDYESPKDCAEETDRSQPRESRLLFVSNLDTNITKQDLSNSFGRFGEIVDTYINSLPGSTRPFAFLQFALTPSVTSAIQAMNGAFLGKCQIVLSYGVIQPSRCVCVEGLSSSVSNEYLIQRFGGHGAIERLLYDEKKGAALILYSEEDASQKAVNTTRNLKTTGETIIMDYANDSFQLNFCQSLLESQGPNKPKT